MKKSIAWLLTLFITPWLGCNQGNVEMDNAGEVPLKVTIDKLPYQVPAQSTKQIQLEEGMHEVLVQNLQGDLLRDTTFKVRQGGLLNVGQTIYYIWADLYGDPSLRQQHLQEKWINIGNESFYGEFEKVSASQLYVERRWDYDLEEGFPDDLYGWKMTQEKWIVKRKLFRRQQLIEAYKKMIQ
jgi:hypothetical protein